MNRHELARRIAMTANALITISLFLVMLWWRASLVLFTTCWMMYCAAWWIEGSYRDPQPSGSARPPIVPFTVPR